MTRKVKSQKRPKAKTLPGKRPKVKRAVPVPPPSKVLPADTAKVEVARVVKEVEKPERDSRSSSSYRDDADSGIKIYLREIGQTPLLTVQEEIKLAARIKRGDQAARTHMIKANLRLVVKIAHDYSNYGLPLLDLISEGNIGLMKAVERFDPKKGGKLSTYGAWWIKQSIKRALANQSKTIRLPVHLVDKIAKMKRTAMRLSEELGREPTDEELGERIGVSASKVAQLRVISIRPASLDAPMGDSDSTEFGEIVPDEDAFSPYDMLHDKTLRDDIRQMLTKLDEREARIINLRFGIDGRKALTLEEVGEKFKVTRERIRQIQNIALDKLRRHLEKHEQIKPLKADSR
ncbi:MAG: RNA polymerase sigma factor RpoD/SigA [Verrucomicrobiae bacterium]|nr:RNA polymerase sigma factor RpoD/SigA [Verrucomicrobiae bacterium]